MSCHARQFKWTCVYYERANCINRNFDVESAHVPNATDEWCKVSHSAAASLTHDAANGMHDPVPAVYEVVQGQAL